MSKMIHLLIVQRSDLFPVNASDLLHPSRNTGNFRTVTITNQVSVAAKEAEGEKEDFTSNTTDRANRKPCSEKNGVVLPICCFLSLGLILAMEPTGGAVPKKTGVVLPIALI